MQRYTRKNVPRDWVSTDAWAPINTDGLDDDQKVRIATLSDAIQRYVAGEPISSYLLEMGVSRTSFLRAFNRCLARDERGRQLQWRGLLPGLRVGSPVRRKPLIPSGRNGRGGLSGALQMLLSQHEEIKQALDEYLLRNAKRKDDSESKLRHKSAHQKFIAFCRENEIQDNEWPFNTKKEGKGALYAYVNRFIQARYDDVVATQYGERAKAKSNTGKGYPTRLSAMRPLDVVELDEHKCHFIGSIGLPTLDGTRWLPVQRVTIVLCADRNSGTILGYKAVFRREADSDDVLDALNAACGKKLVHIFSDGMGYTPQGGFPCDLGEPFTWCGFNQLLLDNALVHIAEPVISRARAIIGFDVNYGMVRRFERRAVVEGIFSEIERAGFQRVQSTTGSGPQDPVRQNPERAATEAKLSLAQALDLIEAVIADHNGKVGKRNFGVRRLERLQALVQDDDGLGMIFPVLPALRPETPSLEISIVPLVVRGNQKKGRRPQVYFEEEEYLGTELCERWDLIGKQVFGHIDRNEIRTFDLFLENGSRVDTVTVRGRWRHSPHSRDIRRHINSDIRDGYLRVGYDEDPVHLHQAAMAERLAQNKSTKSGLRKSTVTAYAEEQRVRAQAAATSTQDLMNGALTQAEGGDTVESEDDDVWSMEDLKSFNGANL